MRHEIGWTEHIGQAGSNSYALVFTGLGTTRSNCMQCSWANIAWHALHKLQSASELGHFDLILPHYHEGDQTGRLIVDLIILFCMNSASPAPFS